jgi:predicted aspartyl protease
VFVPVELSGPSGHGETFDFVLDTGTSRTIIDVGAADRIGFGTGAAIGRSRVSSALGVELGYMVRTPRIAALGWERTEFEIACHHLGANADVHGVLGIDFFAGLRLVIDFAASTVELTAPASP